MLGDDGNNHDYDCQTWKCSSLTPGMEDLCSSRNYWTSTDRDQLSVDLEELVEGSNWRSVDGDSHTCCDRWVVGDR